MTIMMPKSFAIAAGIIEVSSQSTVEDIISPPIATIANNMAWIMALPPVVLSSKVQILFMK